MAISLTDIKRNTTGAPRIVLYGVAGIGKTTLAACAPKPIFLQTEDGLGRIDADALIAAGADEFVAAIERAATLYKDVLGLIICAPPIPFPTIDTHIVATRRWEWFELSGAEVIVFVSLEPGLGDVAAELFHQGGRGHGGAAGGEKVVDDDDVVAFGDGVAYPMDQGYTQTAYVRCVR